VKRERSVCLKCGGVGDGLKQQSFLLYKLTLDLYIRDLNYVALHMS